MNKTVPEALELVEALKPLVANAKAEVVVCPPFTALWSVGQALQGTDIAMGAQNLFWEAKGAYTSQIAPGMLLDVNCKYVIIGHSETRGRFGTADANLPADEICVFGDTDATVNRKAKVAINSGLIPIICCGEMLAERQAGKTDEVIASQIRKALDGIPTEAVRSIVIAYEPVWAIGTGEVCDSDEANRVCGVVRSTVAEVCGQAVAQAVRIQYGGSMKPDNAVELLSKPEIDGGLIGGAALKAADFQAIIAAAE
jgi:triosephosphate isomerase